MVANKKERTTGPSVIVSYHKLNRRYFGVNPRKTTAFTVSARPIIAVVSVVSTQVPATLVCNASPSGACPQPLRK